MNRMESNGYAFFEVILINKIYNPCIFQGKKQIKENKEYFEGWYYKNTNGKETISFIPGICSNAEQKEAFVQVITQEKSWYIPYEITEFSYTNKPFAIKIGDNYFSKEKIELKIDSDQVHINGLLQYQGETPIQHNWISPNIMGFFSFIPTMECNHAIVSMKHNISGRIEIDHEKIEFTSGTGYIEKDWGTSFPSEYIWGQANCFSNQSASLFFAIATIPFQGFHFQGLICDLILEEKEYRFATYNGGKIIRNEITKEGIHLILKKNNFTLEIISKSNKTNMLKAPQKGKMKNHIQESIEAEIEIILKQGDKICYQDKSNCAGLEMICDLT